MPKPSKMSKQAEQASSFLSRVITIGGLILFFGFCAYGFYDLAFDYFEIDANRKREQTAQKEEQEQRAELKASLPQLKKELQGALKERRFGKAVRTFKAIKEVAPLDPIIATTWKEVGRMERVGDMPERIKEIKSLVAAKEYYRAYQMAAKCLYNISWEDKMVLPEEKAWSKELLELRAKIKKESDEDLTLRLD